MEIRIRAQLDHATDSLLMHAYSDVTVPWLFKIFENTILTQIEDSVREYGGGAVSSVGVLRARRHLRAGFQQCKSIVEMGTVRCCPL